jgi:dTDP-4-dehydrorhamnose 3,5-epimerase
MQVIDLPLAGLKLLTPKIFKDERGFFFESWRRDVIDVDFVQDNQSRSGEGTVRGLHFQKGKGQAKLVRVVRGKVFDVAVDIRPDSPTFGKWHAETLDAHTQTAVFIPAGFAHGFCVLSEHGADVLYTVSAYYDPATETGFTWNDPDVGVAWPVKQPVLAKRDQTARSFAALRRELGR